MSKGSSEPESRVPMELREVIAENVNRYIPIEIEAAVAERGGFNPKTITRLRYPESYPEHGVSVGSLVRLSTGLRLVTATDIEPWEWLRPRGNRPILEGREDRPVEKPSAYATSPKRRKKGGSGKS